MKPGEAPFCGSFLQCRVEGKKNCLKCGMFETYKDELYKRD